VFVGDEILGAIDYMAVEWPPGVRVTGEGFGLLSDLVARGVIRVLDLAFVAKSADGAVQQVRLADVEHGADLDLTVWDGAPSGLLDESDIDAVAAVIEPGALAGIMVYENVWTVPLLTAIDRSNARLVGAGRIAADDLVAALDVTEAR
jgi:Family of unknown function (DUF6325)